MRLYSTQCPKCAELGKDTSRDNLSVYDDGHSYCFSCGYYQPGSAVAKHKSNRVVKEVQAIPEDITKTINENALKWIHKYLDTVPSNFYYSESQQSLIVVLSDTAWQKRYFGKNKDYPKWVSYGIDDNFFYIVGEQSKSIVLVEDVISGTKVGHIHTCMPIFGSNISANRITKLLLLGYTNIILWLDPDKHNYMIERKKQLDKYCNCSVILSDKDPKDYSNAEIKHELSLPD